MSDDIERKLEMMEARIQEDPERFEELPDLSELLASSPVHLYGGPSYSHSHHSHPTYVQTVYGMISSTETVQRSGPNTTFRNVSINRQNTSGLYDGAI